MTFPLVTRARLEAEQRAKVAEQDANLNLLARLARAQDAKAAAEAELAAFKAKFDRPRDHGRFAPKTTPAQAVEAEPPLTGVPAEGVAPTGVATSSAIPTNGVPGISVSYAPDCIAKVTSVTTPRHLSAVPQDAVLDEDDDRDWGGDGA